MLFPSVDGPAWLARHARRHCFPRPMTDIFLMPAIDHTKIFVHEKPNESNTPSEIVTDFGHQSLEYVFHIFSTKSKSMFQQLKRNMQHGRRCCHRSVFYLLGFLVLCETFASDNPSIIHGNDVATYSNDKPNFGLLIASDNTSIIHDNNVATYNSNDRPIFGLLDNGAGLGKALELSGDKIASKKKPFPHVKASLLTVALFAILRWNKSRFFGVFFFYILETSFCSTRRYLSNSITPSEFIDYLNTLKKTPMEIIWGVECYHYRTSLVGRHRKGLKATKQKVTTYRASQKFIFER